MEATVIAGGTRHCVRITFTEDEGSKTRVAFDYGKGLVPYVGQVTQITFDGNTMYALFIEQSDPYSSEDWRYAGYYDNGGASETW